MCGGGGEVGRELAAAWGGAASDWAEMVRAGDACESAHAVSLIHSLSLNYPLPRALTLSLAATAAQWEWPRHPSIRSADRVVSFFVFPFRLGRFERVRRARRDQKVHDDDEGEGIARCDHSMAHAQR